MLKMTTVVVALLALVGCGSGGTDTPPEPTGAELDRAVRGSDDYKHYGPAFVRAARDLVRRGHCTIDQIRNHGGFMWSKDRSQHGGQGGTYFIVCGSTVASRWYVQVPRDGSTHRLFQARR